MVRQGDQKYCDFTGGAADIWIGLLDDNNEKPIKVCAFLHSSGTYSRLMLSIKVAIKVPRWNQGDDTAEREDQVKSMKRVPTCLFFTIGLFH